MDELDAALLVPEVVEEDALLSEFALLVALVAEELAELVAGEVVELLLPPPPPPPHANRAAEMTVARRAVHKLLPVLLTISPPFVSSLPDRQDVNIYFGQMIPVTSDVFIRTA